ncbi:erythromycin esterase family protein [Massilia sp. RP-1-19]|uniref:Erythromycin esterase family protein n=1 Tax=Massilia polaris TaxID=2728846 RepID=A0A848HIB9_9BURK|nr:erythromycin esterase family protein [Massilia polaris]NML59940.1 erythromycin esterase family protein [Massilia polaris]
MLHRASPLAAAIAKAAVPLTGGADDYTPLLDMVGEANYVLLGEATHGTHEFYEERARITQRLIVEKGFNAVAVEADWPDAYRVNRFVRDQGDDSDAVQSLQGFQRFPSWMWRNTAVVDFVTWLRSYNDGFEADDKVGFYGLDLYSLFTSMDEVLRYLEQVDPAGAAAAKARYACFDHYQDDSERYAYAAGVGVSESCEGAVIAQLQALQQRALEYMQRDTANAHDAYFYAQQNARLVINAEAYYRTMFRGRVSSWNLRDQHMADTLDALIGHVGAQTGTQAKVVVWEHNSHIGDARATEAGKLGEWNVGQLARERHGDQTRLIGFSTYDGTVTAASEWGGRAERKQVRAALPDSYEALFHDVGIERFMLDLRIDGLVRAALMEHRLQRAIGVLYVPKTERQSHYFHAQLPRQFDAMLHFDRTTAVVPLETVSKPTGGEAPETYPEGV